MNPNENGSFDDMMAAERISYSVMDNRTSRSFYQYLSDEETIENMVESIEKEGNISFS